MDCDPELPTILKYSKDQKMEKLQGDLDKLELQKLESHVTQRTRHIDLLIYSQTKFGVVTINSREWNVAQYDVPAEMKVHL